MNTLGCVNGCCFLLPPWFVVVAMLEAPEERDSEVPHVAMDAPPGGCGSGSGPVGGLPGSSAPWFPRPRGAAPHGPGGVPKRWNHATGTWEAMVLGAEAGTAAAAAATAAAAAATAAAMRDAAPRLISRPRGAVSTHVCHDHVAPPKRAPAVPGFRRSARSRRGSATSPARPMPRASNRSRTPCLRRPPHALRLTPLAR